MTAMPQQILILADDLRLLWFDPVDGTLFRPRGIGGGETRRTQEKLSGAAMLFELLNCGAAAQVPGRMSRTLRRFVEQGRATAPMRVVATGTPPGRPELLAAWESLARRRRPCEPDLALALARRPFDPDERLVAAGVVERAAGTPRLTEHGRAVARSRRDELDSYVLDGVRPAEGFTPTTLRLAGLLALSSGVWHGGVWQNPHRAPSATVERRLVELRTELELGPDAPVWRTVERGVRAATLNPASV